MGIITPKLKQQTKLLFNQKLKFIQSLFAVMLLSNISGFAHLGKMESSMMAEPIFNRAVWNTNSCFSAGDYALYLNINGLDKHFASSEGTFVEYDDGTAELNMYVINNEDATKRFQVQAFFTGRTFSAPAGSPKNNSCSNFNNNDWYYYTSTQGTLTGVNGYAGAVLSFDRLGPAFQLGNGANVTDGSGNFGASGWLDLTIESQPNNGHINFVVVDGGLNQGDFNIQLSGNPFPPCVNVTDGGSISGPGPVCPTANDPGLITSTALPTGGSGDIEYLWLSSTVSCPNSLQDFISGATNATYNPGPINQTTWFVRCSRRAGCDSWDFGESNCVKIEMLDNCGDPAPTGWTVSCEDDQSVEIIGEGIRCQNNFTINIPDAADVVQVVAEVVYKGTNANPSQLTIRTNNETAIVAAEYTQPSRAYYFRTTFGPANQVVLDHIPNACQAQSLLLYVFRSGGNTTASTGRFVQTWLYQGQHCEILEIPTAPAIRDVEIKVPLSEITSDGRIAIVRAEVVDNPAVNAEVIINDYNQGDALNIATLVLSGVAPLEDEIEICVESPVGTNTTPNGQSLVYAGAIKANPECKTCDDSDLGLTAEVISNYNGAQISCAGAADGRLQALVSGGVPPFVYNWSNGDEGQIISNVAPGTYTVTITDRFGCQAVAAGISIDEPSPVNVNIEITSDYTGSPISCNGEADASIKAVASGGTGSYTYQWGVNGNFSNAQELTNLGAGTYEVLASDENGCTAIANITLEAPEVFEAEVDITSTNDNDFDISCAGAADGTIEISAQGGTAPYIYNWSNGATTSSLNNLGPATYTVTITDQNDCEIIRSVTLTEPLPLSLEVNVNSFYNGFNISCFGENDGSAVGLASGGYGILTYAWSNGATTANINELTAGTYSLTVTDENNCTIEGEVTLTEPTLLNVTAEVISNYNGTDISCAGANDGRAQVLISGSVAPYSINWSNGENTQIISDLSPGIYTVTVTDANNCEMISAVTIVEPETISCYAAVTSSYYEGVAISTIGGNDGSAEVTVTGGSGNISYAWSDANNSSTAAVTRLTAGTYNVIASDVNGCTCQSTITLEDPAKVGNQIFIDTNGNGIYDLGDLAFANVELTLTGTSNSGVSITRTLTTDVNGNYDFDGLLPGNYKITLDVPAGYNLTYLNIGGNEALDSDFDPATSMTEVFGLAAGEYNDQVDGGLFAYGKVGDYAWIDCDKNGKQDNGESPLPSVEVILSGTNGLGENVNLTATTDANGLYEFINLAPGNYKLTFGYPVTPTGLGFTGLNQVVNPALDSDVDPQTGMTAFFELKSGETNEDLDAGYQDIEAPILFGIPQDEQVNCAAVPDVPTLYSDITATDNLDQNVEIIFTETSTQGTGDACSTYDYTITRNWVAKDDCGNESTRTQIINVSDDLVPILIGIPNDLTIDCSEVPAPDNVTATDNCDDDLTVQFVEQRIDGSCANDFKLIRTWTVVDECGNTTFETQEIIVEDKDEPVFSGVPADITLSCEEYSGYTTPTITVDDNCSLDLDIDFVEELLSQSCENTFVLQLTWTAVDECGNTTVERQKITVFDEAAPELSGVPADVTLSCEDYNNLPAANVTATDNCTADLDINFVEEFTNQSCAHTFILIRTWSVADACGNTTVETQTITVSDDEDPVMIGVPADINLSCEDYVGYTSPNVTATDNCSANLRVDFVEEVIEQPCANTFVLKLTWSATDECGNTTTEIQNIRVTDDVAPELSGVPSDVTLSCQDYADYTRPIVTVTDNCSIGLTVDFVEEIIEQSCENTFILKNTWTAVDECGNTTTETQTITVSDDEAPILTGIPADLTLSCEAYAGYNNPLVTVSDNCTTGISIDFVEEIIEQECDNTFKLRLTWTAFDACGNSTSETQNITVSDDEAPILTGVPADISLSCEDYAGYQTPIVTVTDNCTTGISIDFVEEIIEQECENTFKLKLTWTAVDDCGNTTTEMQTITVSDDEAPVLSGVPADVTLSCEDYAGYQTPNVIVNDNCTAGITIDFVEEVIEQECENTFRLKLTWTAVDACDNTTSESQTITVSDDEAPVLSGVPADVTFSCEDYAGYQTPNVTATDNCTSDITVDVIEEILGQSCANIFVLQLTWTAVDECGNTTSEKQQITVIDDEAPVLSGVPADVTLSCEDYAGYQTPNVTVSDNCTADIDINFIEQIIEQSCANAFILELTWTATDECGNSTSEKQLITVEDNTAPELSDIPANVEVDCSEIPDVPTNISATDNCTTPIDVQFIEQLIEGSCENEYVLKRTWTAIDECGNSTSETQEIFVSDEIDPELHGVPADVSVACDDANIDIPNVTASDNCTDNLSVVFSEVVVPGNCDDAYSLIRTWTVTDECGNSASDSQTILVSDDLAPVLDTAPAYVTVDCDDIPAVAQLTATDNCGGDVEVFFNEAFQPGNCQHSYVLIRTWSSTDACGNTTTERQEITVDDTEAPQIIGVPTASTVNCGSNDIITVPNVTVEDNCDANASLSMEENLIPGNCPNTYTLTRTWTAIDACGNENTATQTINVVDNTDPILYGIPNDIDVTCGQIPAPANVTAEDACQGIVDVQFIELNELGDCPGNFIIKRIWTATDACGNQTSETQLINVSDVIAPELSGLPADLTINISAGDVIPDAAVLTALDDCDGAATVTFEEFESPAGNCGYLITRTWSASDGCDNTVSHTQTITVLDQLNATLEPNQATACAGEEVNFEVFVAGSGFTFTWDATGGNLNANGMTAVFNAADPGTYTIQVSITDDNGCEVVLKSQVTVSNPISIDLTSNSPVCGGDDLALYADGGDDYLWSGPDNFSSTEANPVISNVTSENAGTYTVEISAGGCKITESIEILIGDPLIVDYSVFPAECGELGSINVGAVGGNGAITFDWADLPGTDNPSNRTDLIPGEYDVTVSDEFGCTQVLNDLLLVDNCDCDADAGGLNLDNEDVCLENGAATFSATLNGNEVIPTGYQVLYLLTTGNDNIIIQSLNPATFTVNQPGSYRIHTLVYNPTTFNLNTIQFGQTTAADVHANFTEAGGQICGSLDIEGVQINVVRPFAEIASNQPEICDGENGKVTLSPANYTYNWSDGGTGAIRTNLSAGYYLVIATSPEGCQLEVDVLVDETCLCTAPLISDIIIFEAHCDAADGSAEIIPAGNINDYSYSWSTNQGIPNGLGNIRTGLAPGIYSVTVADNNFNDCETIVDFSIGTVDGPQVESIDIAAASCNSENGKVTFLPTTNSYIWTHDNGTGNTRSDLAAGTYQVIVMDGNVPPCADIITIEVDSENGLDLLAETVEAPTCGANNGVVKITTNGGSNNLEYIWSDNVTLTNALRNGLAVGDYEVTVVDMESGCTETISFVLNANVGQAGILLTNVQSETCVGENDGAVEYVVNTSPDFAGQPNTVVVDANGNIVDNNNLSAGSYTIQVEDGNGCLAGSTTFEINEATEIRVDVGVLDATCDNDGQIIIEVNGGQPDYTFDWADLAGTNNVQNRTDLSDGFYNLTIKDVNGCTIEILDIEIEKDCAQSCTTPVIANTVVIEASCNLANGSITIEMVQDNDDFNYTIAPNTGIADGNTFTNLLAGAYEVTIENPNYNNCSITTTVIVPNLDGPVAELINSSPSECGQTNGTAVLAPFNYSYEWCNGVIDFNPSNLPAGTCQVTITDPSTGCSNVMLVEIPELNTLDAIAQINNNPSCGENNGSVTINVIGGSGNINYNWSDGGSGKTRTDLAEGQYTVNIEDLENGCSTSYQFALAADIHGDVQIIFSTALPVLTSCNGSADGTIDYTLIPSADFNLPATSIIEDQNGAIVENGELTAGEYCLLIKDANDCLANSYCFEVVAPVQIEVDIAITAADCDNGGSILVEAFGGTPGYIFDWADIAGNDNSQNRTDLAEGSYSLTVYDNNGCSALVQNIQINDDCDPCGSPDAMSMVLMINSEDQYCFDLESCFDPSQVTYVLDDGSMNGSSTFGNWELDVNGCLIYTAQDIPGQDVDQVCIIASDGTVNDTTCITYSIISMSLSNSDVDTIYVVTPVDEPVDDCLDIEDIGGFTDGSSLNTQNVDNGSLLFIDNCFTYTPNPGATGMFLDTATMVLCNSMLQLCDTTVMIFSITPDAGGCLPIFNQTDETVFATDCQVGAEYCLLGLDDNDFVDLSLFDNGDLYTNDFTNCGSNNTEILLTVGLHELIIIDNNNGCQDTLNVQVNCDDCDDFYTGPSEIIIADCSAGAEICLDFEIADLFDFNITVDDTTYAGNYNVCVVDTQYQYVAFQLGQPAAYTLESWEANGQTFTLDLFTSPQQLTDSMNVWDPSGNWEVFGFVIVGGNGTGNYGPLVISAVNIPTFSVPNQIIPDATTITLSEGMHTVNVENLVDGCVQNFNVNVICSDPPIIVDTLITIFEGTLDTFCFDLPLVNSITNLCPNNNDGNTLIELIPGTSCIEISGLQFGNDEYCLEACDTNTGNCVTVNIGINVVPVTDTIFETISLGLTDTLCIDTSFFENAIFSFINDCENPNNLSVDFDIDADNICVNYTGDLVGIDTACLIVCDDLGVCDTTIFIVEVIVPTPETLVLPILVGDTDTICLDISELTADVESVINICPETIGENASIIVDPTTNCIFYTGLEIGLDTACMVICDEAMICDTTFLIFDVFNNLLPVAIDDDTTTTIGNSVVIEVLLNDTINGNLEGFEIIGFPQHGNVIVNPDGTITYTPEENFCGELDSFSYSITNEFGSDTALVTVDILCQELIIFSGFSPNGDNVNDVFTVLGIENFPDNEVFIFNRWGNQVHNEMGYRNDRGWNGTFDGKHLPDGTYFYVINDGEGNTYSGYLQIHR